MCSNGFRNLAWVFLVGLIKQLSTSALSGSIPIHFITLHLYNVIISAMITLAFIMTHFYNFCYNTIGTKKL